MPLEGALPGVRELGTFEVEVRTGGDWLRLDSAGWKSGSQALPGMDDSAEQNRTPASGPLANTFRMVQDTGGNGQTEAACEVFWNEGWTDPEWRFHVPPAARADFLEDLHGGGPGAGAAGDGNRFCTNFDVFNDFTRDLRNVWIVVDGFSIPGVRGFVDFAPRSVPSEEDGEPDIVLEPWSQQGLFSYGDMAEGESVRFQWYFYFGDAEVRDFTIRGRLVEILDEVCGSGEDDNGDGLVDSGCGTFAPGEPCLGHEDCGSGQCPGGSRLNGMLGTCTISDLGEPCSSDADCSGTLVCASTGEDTAMCWDEHFCNSGHRVVDFVDPGNFLCSPIDHCADGTDLCHEEATCVYSGPGRYRCDCPVLWAGTGYHCEYMEPDAGRVIPIANGLFVPSNEVVLMLMEPGNLVFNWHFLDSPTGWSMSTDHCSSNPGPCAMFEPQIRWTGRWRSSYIEGWKEQTVDLVAAGYGPDELDGPGQMPIVVREFTIRTIDWVSTRYRLLSYLQNAGGTVVASNTTMLDNTNPSYPWEPSYNVVEHRYDSYPDGVRQVRHRTTGIDLGFWAGYFGPIAMWPVVRIGEVDMRFSDDMGTTWGPWEPFEPRVTHTFPEPEGLQTVLIQMRDWTGGIHEHRVDVIVAPDLF